MTVAFVVEVRKNGADEWERLGTFFSKESAAKLEKLARRTIDVAEARVVEK